MYIYFAIFVTVVEILVFNIFFFLEHKNTPSEISYYGASIVPVLLAVFKYVYSVEYSLVILIYFIGLKCKN